MNATNARGLARKNNYKGEAQAYAAYRCAIKAIGTVNTPEAAKAYLALLQEHLGIAGITIEKN